MRTTINTPLGPVVVDHDTPGQDDRPLRDVYDNMGQAALRRECRERSLPANGTNATLRTRLRAADAAG